MIRPTTEWRTVILNGVRNEKWAYLPLPPADAFAYCSSIPPCTPTPVWSDEFDGTALDTTKWTTVKFHPDNQYNELQIYQADDAYLSGDGNLVLSSQKRHVGGYAYTSGAIWSLDKYWKKYGYFEARIKSPSGSGMWPGWWTTGQEITANCPGDSTGSCGLWPPEIDIFEYVTRLPTQYNTGNWYGYNQGMSQWIYTGQDLRNTCMFTDWSGCRLS